MKTALDIVIKNFMKGLKELVPEDTFMFHLASETCIYNVFLRRHMICIMTFSPQNLTIKYNDPILDIDKLIILDYDNPNQFDVAKVYRIICHITKNDKYHQFLKDGGNNFLDVEIKKGEI